MQRPGSRLNSDGIAAADEPHEVVMGTWLRNVWVAVTTVIYGMWVTIWTMNKTYRRRTFTEVYE